MVVAVAAGVGTVLAALIAGASGLFVAWSRASSEQDRAAANRVIETILHGAFDPAVAWVAQTSELVQYHAMPGYSMKSYLELSFPYQALLSLDQRYGRDWAPSALSLHLAMHKAASETNQVTLGDIRELSRLCREIIWYQDQQERHLLCGELRRTWWGLVARRRFGPSRTAENSGGFGRELPGATIET